MRKLALLAAAAALAATASPALAGANHGFCALGDTCIDNGTNTPTSTQPPVFGFSGSGTQGPGEFYVAILVPDNVTPPADFQISGWQSGTASLVDGTTPWTGATPPPGGQTLADYLGFSASPNNPIGAYLPATLDLGVNADGYWVYLADLGSDITLIATGDVGKAGQDDYLMTLDQNLAIGGYILGFLDTGDKNIQATANSAAILETGGVPEPATWAMMLIGFGAVGVSLRRSRRKQAVAQLA